MQRQERGGSTLSTVVGLVVVAAVVVGGLYLFSDVFRTKIDSHFRQFSDWTPENIAKDPQNYLNFCEEKAKGALEKLKASEISIAQRRASLDERKTKHAGLVRAGEAELTILKDLFRGAEAAGLSTVSYAGSERPLTDIKRQIMNLFGQTEQSRAQILTVERGLTQIEAARNKVMEQRDVCQQQIEKIKSNRELLKVKELSDGIKEQLVDLKGVLATAIDSVGDSSSMPTLEDLAAAPTVDDSKFAEIMKL